MIPQQPAEGILKHNDWGDSKVYRVTYALAETLITTPPIFM